MLLQKIRDLFRGRPNFQPIVDAIGALEPGMRELAEGELPKKTEELKAALKEGKTLDELLPAAFALVREAARRTLRQRHFDVQLIGGMILHRGAIAEMLTGEGKTLTSTLPVYLNALTGEGVHVITVNEYLARRDAVWMGQIYHALGLSVACLVHEGAFLYDPTWHIPEDGEKLIDKERDTTGNFLVQQEFLRPISRREAYLADITYGTNHEFGFDYLRDHLRYALEEQVQRGHNYAMIDEVDSVLIDEARTPLIISAPDNESSELYKSFARVVRNLNEGEDYLVDEKLKSATITESGIERVEKLMGVKDLYSAENLRLVHFLNESLRAKGLYGKDRDYVVKDGEIIIIDQFTGRMMMGRRYSGGLHQAIEAKEGVAVKEESRTYATITIQNYFRLYKKISGMTGTAQTSAEEFHKVYKLEVMNVPSNRPLARKDSPDRIYKNTKAKFEAIAKEVKERHEKGQPVLIGTVSIEKNELLSAFLNKEGVPHEILNAKKHEQEGAIIAQAGRRGAVTVATNVAGRGVDIILGGNPPKPEEAQQVRELGGLHVIGTERHEARRIDNQLRGRAGRQGDPGSSLFFLSLEDDLMRVFGGDRLKSVMNTLNVPEDVPIESRFVSRAVSDAQSKIEGMNFDARKHLLDFDDVLNKQRLAVYKKRQAILSILDKEDLRKLLLEISEAHVSRVVQAISVMPEEYGAEERKGRATQFVKDAGIAIDEATSQRVEEAIARGDEESLSEAKEIIRNLVRAKLGGVVENQSMKGSILGVLDMLWMSHLEMMEALAESVRLRAYAQHDPLVEYRREGHILFRDLFANFEGQVFGSMCKLSAAPVAVQAIPKQVTAAPEAANIGRNDPCYCGSGKKYKKCHGA